MKDNDIEQDDDIDVMMMTIVYVLQDGIDINSFKIVFYTAYVRDH